MTEPTPKIDLNIRGENVQELYSWFLGGRLVVNRRYQRKLVWTKDEKARLIDTITKGFPLPIILLAEIIVDGVSKYEIIDGMQRLDAIFAFVENKYEYEGKYFDLTTMATSKELLDSGRLKQAPATLSRSVCAQIANYKIPLSTYRIDTTGDIDEIFRRINSYGRGLSNQEIRQAGVTGVFADLVRSISCSIRGDVSHREILSLKDMEAISINAKDLEYGITVESMLWIQGGVLLRDDIRASRDEEIIADIVAYVVSEEGDKPPSSRQALDAFYGRSTQSAPIEQDKANQRKVQIDLLVNMSNKTTLQSRIVATIDLFRDIFDPEKFKFSDALEGVSSNYGTPRYFQVTFLALYELLYVDKLKLADRNGARKGLRAMDKHLDITTGGNWSAANRTKNVDVVKGLVRKFFKKNPTDPTAQVGQTEFVNLLTRSKTEAPSYDFKQGLHRLDEKKNFDEGAFTGILETICALANLGKGRCGYIVIGVADTARDAKRVADLYGSKPVKVGEFFFVGIAREAIPAQGSVDKYLQMLSDRVRSSTLSDETRIRVAANMSTITYQGESAVIIQVDAGSEPCFLGETAYRRVGSQTVKVSAKEVLQLNKLF